MAGEEEEETEEEERARECFGRPSFDRSFCVYTHSCCICSSSWETTWSLKLILRVLCLSLLPPRRQV